MFHRDSQDVLRNIIRSYLSEIGGRVFGYKASSSGRRMMSSADNKDEDGDLLTDEGDGS